MEVFKQDLGKELLCLRSICQKKELSRDSSNAGADPPHCSFLGTTLHLGSSWDGKTPSHKPQLQSNPPTRRALFPSSLKLKETSNDSAYKPLQNYGPNPHI